MSDIKLVSEEYTSKFVTGPELQMELSKKQDNVGLSLDDMGTVFINGGFCQAGYPCDNIIEGTVNFYSSIYDKDGNEINGGGGGSKWVTDEMDGGTSILHLGKDENGNTVNSIFVYGPLYSDHLAEVKFTGDFGTGDAGVKITCWGGDSGSENGAFVIANPNSPGEQLILSGRCCTYYDGPFISTGPDPSGTSLTISAPESIILRIATDGQYETGKVAIIDKNNIDKLINLLNS